MTVAERMMARQAVIMKDSRIYWIESVTGLVRLSPDNKVQKGQVAYTSTSNARVACGGVWRVRAFRVLEERHGG